ncbi:MAG: tetratricopeptide repeat protein [Thermodesulfobacteriota bacterium]
MTEQEKVKALLKEASVYKNQGLFTQAKEKFSNALEIMSQSGALQSNEALIADIEEKLRELNTTLKEIEDDTQPPELSDDVQELIKKSFAFSKDREAAAIEGAMALAKFGQFDKASKEFNEILEYTRLPVMIAKNIIRCHLNTSSPEKAVEQFKGWAGGDRFSREEILHLEEFLQGVMESRGIALDIPLMEGPAAGTQGEAIQEDDELDISSVNIRLESGSEKEWIEDFPVEFQSGNTISVIVPVSNKELVRIMRHGMRLPVVQCFSSIGFILGSGTVTGKTKVLQGPNQGNFMVDIRLDD